MNIIKLSGFIFASFLLTASLAQPAQAELKGYNFFLEVEPTPIDDGALYVGELFIDDSLSGGFYSFEQIEAAGGSLSITIEGIPFTLEYSSSPSEEGIITDASGAPTSFADIADPPDGGVVFTNPLPAQLIIHPVYQVWAFISSPGGLLVFGEPITFAPIPDPQPTADAGPDQAIRGVTEVTLDGTGSFDDDTATADLLYDWQLITKPDGSDAVLVDADTATPSFVADVLGDYTVMLIVTDGAGLTSAPDTVVISSDNLAPTAVAGDNRLIVVNETVALDGSGSTDPEMDPLTFAWTIESAPDDSTAMIVDADSAAPSFTPDVTGLYRIQLVVSDLIGPGEPATVEITAASAEDIAEITIVEAANLVGALPPSGVTSPGNQSAFGDFLAEAVAAIQSGDIEEALEKLDNARGRTDGCPLSGAADGNGPGRDWLTDDPDCSAQNEVYALLTYAINLLTP